MIVGILGNARVGKDTMADYLVRRHGFKKMALADPMKELCQRLFSFSDSQLWGSERDLPDSRYRRADGEPLTPRFALQTLGTEWGRRCDPEVWVRRLLWRYNDLHPGWGEPTNVAVADLRFANEVRAVKAAGGRIVRVYRPGCDGSTLAGVPGHVSEEEQKSIPDSECHHIIHNDGSLDEYHAKIEALATLWAP